MLKKIKGFLSSKFVKAFSVASVSALIACFGCLTCFAEEVSKPDISGTLTTSFQSIQSDIFSYVGIALPIALGVIGLIFGIKLAIKFFMNVARK